MSRAKSEPTDSAVTVTEAAQQSAASDSPEATPDRGSDANAANYFGGVGFDSMGPISETSPGDVIELVEVKVMITRDPACKIPKTVYRHELPALRYIHKPENVLVVSEYPVKVAGFDIDTEFLRLQRKYDRKNFDVVRPVYGLEGDKLQPLTGVARSGRPGTDAPASQNKERAPATETVRRHAA
jgi:hypothetical protein